MGPSCRLKGSVASKVKTSTSNQPEAVKFLPNERKFTTENNCF